MISRWLQLLGCLIVALLLPLSAAKKEKPGISSYKLDDKPFYMFYFENSDTVLMSLEDKTLLRSTDAGENWEAIEDDGMKHGVVSIYQHSFDSNKAYALGEEGKHWITTDQGKTWKSFKISDVPYIKSPQSGPLTFHGRDSSKVIFETRPCPSCALRSYYTKDDFETISVLTESAVGCYWAVGDPQFAADPDVAQGMEDRTLCVVPGLKTGSRFAFRLVYSNDFFSSQEIEAKLQDGRPVSGVTSIAQVKRFIVAAVESQGTTERALYVTVDTEDWHRAEFGDHRIEEDAYTVLESTNYSLQVDVLTDPHGGVGVLFTSNSDGTYFERNIENTYRGPKGYVDFEKLASIQGIYLVNTVSNPASGARRKPVSNITFDDGKTFQALKVDGKPLHLHSVNSDTNIGRVFSSPAPGLVMGVGNTGDYLGEYSDGNLYISDDAGRTWRLAREGPHKYEFGDQGGVVVAISDKGKLKKLQYSLDHGKEWKSIDLPHEIDTRFPTTITTTPDSSSLRFMLIGYSKDDEYIVFSIDFNDMHERKCEEDDFDTDWPARLDENGDPDCLMGRKQFFRRRKANADCFVAEPFNSSASKFVPCKCTAEDFECKYKPTKDGKGCIPSTPITPPEGECKNPTDTFKGPSGYRLIPGDICTREGGEELDKDTELPCEGAGEKPSNGEITSTPTTFGSDVHNYYYLERQVSNTGADETIMMLSQNHELFVSHDHGRNWKQELKDQPNIIGLVRHQYNSDTAYVLTSVLTSDREGLGFYTINRGATWQSFKTKTPPNNENSPILRFHPSKRDWLLWVGEADCDTGNCHSNAYFSNDRGDNWKLILRYAKKCEFEYREDHPDSEHLIFCEQYENENPKNRLQLMSTVDEKFSVWNTTHDDLVAYATRAEYIIVASRNNETGALKASVSVDGFTFADLRFPPNISPAQNLYTVLDTSEHAIFLYVQTNDKKDAEYGSIVKSNSNGTTYVLSLDNVDQNGNGNVDFERTQALEGVILANIVSNVNELSSGTPKKLRTMITHNDGGKWTLLAPPALDDAHGEKFSCSVKRGEGTEECALHLHGYTERVDPRDTFSSGSAIGLMVGQGNVGDYLTSKDEADTFMTSDGGISWKFVKKGRYMWEFGDSGSVIVIVPELKSTKVLHYSTDEGKSWKDYEFSDEEVEVFDISTVPSDTSKSFLLWGTSSNNKPISVNVDFSGLYDRDCVFDKDGGVSEDYLLWTPSHPYQEANCLFGHVEQYRRKKLSAGCWNNWRGPHLHSIEKNCTCTRADYECAYNYQPTSDGSCVLVPGLQPEDPVGYCRANPDAIEYFQGTPYRRIPQTTCQGGKILDGVDTRPCPGKEEQYEKKHGISGVGLFFAIVTPIVAAGLIGYFVYTRWDGKFGQIRLGETSGRSEGWLSRDSLLITVPITIIAGIVAVTKALPLLASSLWRSVSGYVRIGQSRSYPRPYASRASFAARRGDYSSVVDDEDELLGVEEGDVDEDEDL
ncbi:hypothetical protein BJX63DRAFT_423528 [Aspergillus granulosus]|uniref:Vacuolar protein sorting/targeting protein 10 n=1 Tax=Aspergillus granulosus TaxID=176169 RepID=A0ABR4H356_9EURO